MKRTILLALLVTPNAAPLVGQGQLDEPTPSVVAYRNGQVFDGSAFVARDLYVREGFFVEEPTEAPDRSVDLDGLFVIPPFGDAHTHRFHGRADAESARKMFTQEGIFYLANLCCPVDAREQSAPHCNARDAIDVIFANGAFTCTEGHPVGLYRRLHEMWRKPEDTFREENENSTFFEIESESRLREVWPTVLGHKPDLIKIVLAHSHGHVDSDAIDEPNGLHPELVAPVVALAKEAGLRVVAHVEDRMDFRYAVEGGCDAVVHLPGYNFRSPPTDASRWVHGLHVEDARMAAESHVVVVPTIGLSAETRPIREFQAQNLQILKDAGVTFAFGSDRWQDVSGEWGAMLRTGVFSPLELLRMRCVDAPRMIFRNRKIGALELGYEASFLALRANPLDQPTAIGRIEHRVKQGIALNDL